MSWKLSRTVLRGASDGNTVRLFDDKKDTGARQPYYFYLKDKDVFGFAGLWEEWLDKETGEAVETCTIITTAANEVLEPIHDRSSVILKSNHYGKWLDGKEDDTAKLKKFFFRSRHKKWIHTL